MEKILYFFDIKNWEKKVNQFRINYCSESNCCSIDNKALIYEKMSNNEYISAILNILNCNGERIASAIHTYKHKFMLRKTKQKNLRCISFRLNKNSLNKCINIIFEKKILICFYILKIQ